MSYFSTNELSRSFGGNVAVERASVEFEEGRINGLIGPNGSGKTTFFNLVTGMISRDSGEVTYRDRSIAGLAPHVIAQRGIGRTFQLTRIFPKLTVLENTLVAVRRSARFGLLRPAVAGAERERAMYWLARVGIEHLRDVEAGSLSYGQQRLLEIAGVMMAEPGLVLLDEPAGGINPVMVERIAELVRSLNGEGRTFLIVEHNMEFVASICDYVVCFDQGRPIASGTPVEIHADERVLEAYLGG
ncbi:MAG: ABC transporter ATP-binding protein [Candidatus Limnocylindria bacterium]